MKSESRVVSTPPDMSYRVFEIAFREGIQKFVEREIPERPCDMSKTNDFVAFVVTQGEDLDAEHRREAQRAIRRRMQKQSSVDLDLAANS